MLKLVKRWLPRGLFARSLLIMALPVLLLQVVSTFVFFDRHWSVMTNRLAFAVAGEIALAANAIENSDTAPDTEAPEIAKILSRLSAQNLDLLLTYKPGQAWQDSPQKPWKSAIRKPLANALKEQVRRPTIIEVHIPDKWIEVSVKLKDGVLRVLVPQKRLFDSSGYVFILWMTMVSLILLAIAILFMRNQIRPIRRLAIAAERFGKGRDVPNFKPEGAREVRQAANAFLGMRDRIRKQMTQRTAMLASVSHDLRTPLTRLKLQLAMLGDNADVQAMKEDVDAMSCLVDGYLAFARGEGGEPLQRVDLADQISRQVLAHKRQGDDIELSAHTAPVIKGRKLALERGFENIISNALKYGDRARIELWTETSDAVIAIEDNGPGIPPEEHEDVFKPFYRHDTSRNTETGGTGLGLAIAQDVISGHGGQIYLDESPLGGLKVIIRLPL